MGCGYVLAPSEEAWRSWENKRRLSTKNPKDEEEEEEDKDDEDAGDDRKKKGKRKKANVCALEDKTLPRKAIYICASKTGTVIKEKRKGSNRWKIKVSPARARSFGDSELEDIYAGNQKWKLKEAKKKEPEGDDEDETDSEPEGEEKKEKEQKKEKEEKKVVVKRYVGIGALPQSQSDSFAMQWVVKCSSQKVLWTGVLTVRENCCTASVGKGTQQIRTHGSLPRICWVAESF